MTWRLPQLGHFVELVGASPSPLPSLGDKLKKKKKKLFFPFVSAEITPMPLKSNEAATLHSVLHYDQPLPNATYIKCLTKVSKIEDSHVHIVQQSLFLV